MPENPAIMDDPEAPLDLSKIKKKSKKPPPSFLAETDPPAGAADGEKVK